MKNLARIPEGGWSRHDRLADLLRAGDPLSGTQLEPIYTNQPKRDFKVAIMIHT